MFANCSPASSTTCSTSAASCASPVPPAQGDAAGATGSRHRPYNADLGPLKEFILPGGNRAAALTHLARTVCRRAERMTVALAAAEPVSDAGRQYLNRLSDLLFVLGRWLNKAAGGSDVLWQKGKNA
jgi:cob(I)alamin adenosyltransferase